MGPGFQEGRCWSHTKNWSLCLFFSLTGKVIHSFQASHFEKQRAWEAWCISGRADSPRAHLAWAHRGTVLPAWVSRRPSSGNYEAAHRSCQGLPMLSTIPDKTQSLCLSMERYPDGYRRTMTSSAQKGFPVCQASVRRCKVTDSRKCPTCWTLQVMGGWEVAWKGSRQTGMRDGIFRSEKEKKKTNREPEDKQINSHRSHPVLHLCLNCLSKDPVKISSSWACKPRFICIRIVKITTKSYAFAVCQSWC